MQYSATRLFRLAPWLMYCYFFIGLAVPGDFLYAQPPKVSRADLDSHNLHWIKTKNDFVQDKMMAGAVEIEIARVIRNAWLESIMTTEIEVPFNHAALHYLGHVHPALLKLFDAYPLGPDNSDEINKQLYVYKYENFYLSTETNGADDQQNVFYAIRAINLLKYRYDVAYNVLFSQTLSYPTTQKVGPGFANSNKAYWLAFNAHPLYIAVSGTVYLKDTTLSAEIPGTICYKNIPVVSIHANNIQGRYSDTVGSYPIYKLPNRRDDYMLYLREGIVESIVHEMLHRYIDYAQMADSNCRAIVKHRMDSLFYMAEECAVMNTSLNYFARAGGLRNALAAYYYPEIFDDYVSTLRNSGYYARYAALVTGTSANDKDSPRFDFRFSWLDNP